MEYKLGLKPFKDFWISCLFNLRYSILISYDPSYHLATLLNEYTYEFPEIETPNNTKVNYVTFSLRDSYSKKIKEILSEHESLFFKDNPNYLYYLKELIKKGEIITVGVDLFYWIPNSICWNKHHWEHYSLINGFDDEKKVFYVFDENIYGYDEYEIPEERFCVAIQNSPLEPHGYNYRFSHKHPSFQLSLTEVIENAKRLANELNTMNPTSIWHLSEEDFAGGHMRLFAMFVFKIINRHVANQMLFQNLYKEKYIEDLKMIDTLTKYSQDLKNGWNVVRNKFVKTYYSNDKSAKILELNQKCDFLFHLEYQMWNEFLSYILK